VLTAHFVLIGVLAAFGLIWTGLFTYFVIQGAKGSSDFHGPAAFGSFVFAAGCVGGLVAYWINYLSPLLR